MAEPVAMSTHLRTGDVEHPKVGRGARRRNTCRTDGRRPRRTTHGGAGAASPRTVALGAWRGLGEQQTNSAALAPAPALRDVDPAVRRAPADRRPSLWLGPLCIATPSGGYSNNQVLRTCSTTRKNNLEAKFESFSSLLKYYNQVVLMNLTGHFSFRGTCLVLRFTDRFHWTIRNDKKSLPPNQDFHLYFSYVFQNPLLWSSE